MRTLFIPVLIALTSCAVQVKTFQNPDTDFSPYESWCWMQGCEITYQGPDRYYDERVINEVANSIAWNMNDKGYLHGDDRSDLIINFYFVVEEDSAIKEDFFYSTHQGEREWLTMLYPEYQNFLKGSLVIDVIDRATSNLIWTSTAVRYMEINPSYDEQAIWSGVAKAMKKFPVRD